MIKISISFFLFVVAVLSFSPTYAQSMQSYNPVTMDPKKPNWSHPAGVHLLKIPSGKTEMNVRIYTAADAKPHPTVILFHGFPGTTQNADLAFALQRAGFNVVIPQYRGAWGSGGQFTWRNALEDASNTLQYFRSKDNAEPYNVDPTQIALVGHSFGGWVALVTTANHPAIQCVASIAGANLSFFARAAKSDSTVHDKILNNMIKPAVDPESGPIKTTSAQKLLDANTAQLSSAPDTYDLPSRAKDLSSHTLLLIAGKNDHTAPMTQHHVPLVQALKKADAKQLTTVVLNADHSFATRRITLAKTLINWLRHKCKY